MFSIFERDFSSIAEIEKTIGCRLVGGIWRKSKVWLLGVRLSIQTRQECLITEIGLRMWLVWSVEEWRKGCEDGKNDCLGFV